MTNMVHQGAAEAVGTDMIQHPAQHTLPKV
jgi:hypothetical protein